MPAGIRVRKGGGMYECTEAIFYDEIWKAASLKDENGNYKQELRLQMKKERTVLSARSAGKALFLMREISGSLISAITRGAIVC